LMMPTTFFAMRLSFRVQTGARSALPNLLRDS
jgi:hypothetical protein